MPASFTCPRCRQTNYGYTNPPAGDRYKLGVQCSRCGVNDLYWVATQDMADWLVGRTEPGQPSVRPDQIAVGVEDSPIGYMDADVATGNLEQRVVPRLRPVATLVAPYDQGKRIKGFTQNIPQIQEGVCAGQCLHWIRRVLQGGRESYRSPVVKGTVRRTDEELARKQRKQHMVGAKAQLLLHQHQAAATQRLNEARQQMTASHQQRAAQSRNRLAEVDQAIETYLRDRGITRSGESWNISYENQEELQEKERVLDEVFARRDAIIDQINADVAARDAEVDRYNQANARHNSQGFYSYGWGQLARELDQAVAQSAGPSKRTFGNILATRCVNRGDAPFGDGTATAFANGVVNDPDFQPGRAVVLSVGLAVGVGEAGGSISGHAVAVHFVAPNELYLFDPNLGVFRSNSKENLLRAVELLLGPVWQQDFETPWRLDGTFGYAIFRAAAQPTDRQPLERVVNYTTEVAEVMTSQNRAIGTVPSVPDVPVTPPVSPPGPRAPRQGAGGLRVRNVEERRRAPQPQTVSPPRVAPPSPHRPVVPTPVAPRGNVAALRGRFGG